MSNSPWKLLIGPIVLIAFLAVGYSVYWHYMARRLERTTAAWFEERRGKGWSAAHGAMAVGGFPMQLRLTLPNPALAANPAGWRWRSAQAVLEMQPWNWRRFRIVSTGPQTVEFHVDGVWRRIDAVTERSVLIGGIRGDGALSESMIEMTDLTLRDAANRRLVEAAAIRLWLRSPDGREGFGDALSLVLRMTKAEISDRVRLPLGQTIMRLDLDARLHGGLPNGLDAAAVETWRRRGGVVEVEALDFRWGPADVHAAGSVSLDTMMRPAGVLQTRLQGYAETLVALEEARLIGRRDAATARVALDLLARAGPGGARVVSLPVTARDGVLYLGPVRALAMPAIPFWVRSARRNQPGASR